jgi:hypothetical protein
VLGAKRSLGTQSLSHFAESGPVMRRLGRSQASQSREKLHASIWNGDEELFT